MALTECRECGHQIAKSADACPNCGAKVKRTSLLTKIIAVVAVIGLVGYIATPSETSHTEPPSPVEAQRLAALSPEQRAAEEAARRAALDRELGLVWRYREHQDAMTKGTIKSAIVRSLNNIDFAFPYQGSQRGELQLRRHPRYGSDVILSVDRGQFLCRLDDCTIAVRFDDRKAQTYDVVEPADNSSTHLFVRNYSRFLGNVRKAKRAHIEAQFYQEGPRVFEFDVSGLEWK